MKKLSLTIVAVALLLTVVPASTWAQNIELTPYAGYRWTSSITNATATYGNNTITSNIDFKSGAFFGLFFDIDLLERLQLEVTAEGFPTTMRGNLSTGETSDVFDVNLYYFQLGVLYEIIEAGVSKDLIKVRPFIAGALGSTTFDPSGDFQGDTRFNASFSMGFKSFFNQRFGLRIQGRYMWTYMSASNDYFCTGTATGTGTQCTIFPTSTSLSQIDILLGFIIAF
jgi:hypothetical protein